ncbi:helix-turn-helix domain-containing protein, partial [Ilyobacter sp.]|uniref:MerR family transcriptional regulator n=1 Tax=Ilyobacter sp. TaxID=3100343 RepID=UPI00356ADBEF
MKIRYSIGEMSKLFDIPITTLRHYHNKGIFTADYIDEETGYRYYSYEQFELLNNILNLRYGKVPLNKIKEYLEKENIHSLKEVFIEQKEELTQKIEELVKAKKNIEERLSYIERVEKIEIFGEVTEEIRGEREIFSIWKEFIEESELELLVRELGKESNFSCRLIWGKVGLLMEKNKGYKKYSGI